MHALSWMGQYPPGPEGMLLHLSIASETGFLEGVVGESSPGSKGFWTKKRDQVARNSPVPLSRKRMDDRHVPVPRRRFQAIFSGERSPRCLTWLMFWAANKKGARVSAHRNATRHVRGAGVNPVAPFLSNFLSESGEQLVGRTR